MVSSKDVICSSGVMVSPKRITEVFKYSISVAIFTEVNFTRSLH